MIQSQLQILCVFRVTGYKHKFIEVCGIFETQNHTNELICAGQSSMTTNNQNNHMQQQ